MSNRQKTFIYSGSAIVLAGMSALVVAAYAITSVWAYSFEDSNQWTLLADSGKGHWGDRMESGNSNGSDNRGRWSGDNGDNRGNSNGSSSSSNNSSSNSSSSGVSGNAAVSPSSDSRGRGSGRSESEDRSGSSTGSGTANREGRNHEEDRMNHEENHDNRGEHGSWAVARQIDVKNLKFLLNLVARLERIRANIENSQMEPDRKAAFLAQIDAFIASANQRIADLTGAGGSTANDAVSAALSVFWITSDSARTFVRLSNDTVGYYEVVQSGTTAPTAAQLRLGQDGTSSTGSVKASGTITVRNSTFTVSGLSPTTDYVIYFFAENTARTKQTDVLAVDFRTLAVGADITPPVVSSVSLTGTTNSGTMLNFSSNESGTGYYVVVQSGSTAPSSIQVRLGQNGSGTGATISGFWAVSVGANTFAVSGLSPSTNYVAYLVVEDSSHNLQTAPISVMFTTSALPDTTPPVVTSVSLTGTTNSGTMVNFTSDESGTGYYVIALSGSVAPTPAQVKLWQDGSGNTVAVRGSWAVSVGANAFATSGLTAATNYVAYLVVADLAGNIEAAVHALGFTTPN